MKEEKLELQPDEEILIGKWVLEDDHVVGDAACQRIRWLMEN